MVAELWLLPELPQVFPASEPELVEPEPVFLKTKIQRKAEHQLVLVSPTVPVLVRESTQTRNHPRVRELEPMVSPTVPVLLRESIQTRNHPRAWELELEPMVPPMVLVRESTQTKNHPPVRELEPMVRASTLRRKMVLRLELLVYCYCWLKN